MTVAKIIEVIGEGKTIQEAIETAVAEVAVTVSDLKQINVEHIEGLIENNKVTKYRVNAKISFVVKPR